MSLTHAEQQNLRDRWINHFEPKAAIYSDATPPSLPVWVTSSAVISPFHTKNEINIYDPVKYTKFSLKLVVIHYLLCRAELYWKLNICKFIFRQR